MRIDIKKTTVLVVSVLLLTFLSGCSFVDRGLGYLKNISSSTQNPETEKDKPEVQKENAITIGIVELDTYNPLITKSSTMKNMLGFIFEPMFALDKKLGVVSVLAQSYKTAPDGKSIIVNLKPDVIWHDGTPFSATDVVYTVNAVKNSDTNYGKLLQNVSNAEVLDSHTVNIRFNRSVPNPALLLTFPIIKNGSFTENFKPVGTGPFYLDYDRLTAFGEYHGEKPKLEYINVKSVPDNDKFISLFNASVIDVADSAVIDMTEYMPRSNATVHNYVSNEMVYVGFNSKSSVFSFAEARRSVYELIDRRNIVSHIYFSHAKIAHYPINPDFRFYPSVAENTRSDHGAAEKELNDGGWTKDRNGKYFLAGNGATYFSTEILVKSTETEHIKIASELSDVMSDMGMSNTVVVCSDEEFASRISNGDYDMFIGTAELLPNCDLTELLSGDNILNYTDEKTDILLEQLGTVASENDKKAVYAKLFEEIKTECPIAPICFLQESIITGAKLKSGVSPSISGMVLRTENWSVK